ncbi:MAG: hypothetical protein M4D80_11945 [Myxococcota bacterium]|nr:hypothetical protein [Myxococcota bacterium]
MPTNYDDEPEMIGKPHPPSDGAKPGTERARDEQREGGGPRYGGEAWDVADERGDRRFGVARNDDSDPSELAKGEGAEDDDSWPGDDAVPEKSDESDDAEETERVSAVDGAENSGQRAGMGRGEKPQKPKARTK